MLHLEGGGEGGAKKKKKRKILSDFFRVAEQWWLSCGYVTTGEVYHNTYAFIRKFIRKVSMRYEDGCIFQFQRFPVTEGWEFCQERGGKLAAKVLGKLFLFTITSVFNTKHNHASTNADSPTLSSAYFPAIFLPILIYKIPAPPSCHSCLHFLIKRFLPNVI